MKTGETDTSWLYGYDAWNAPLPDPEPYRRRIFAPARVQHRQHHARSLLMSATHPNAIPSAVDVPPTACGARRPSVRSIFPHFDGRLPRVDFGARRSQARRQWSIATSAC